LTLIRSTPTYLHTYRCNFRQPIDGIYKIVYIHWQALSYIVTYIITERSWSYISGLKGSICQFAFYNPHMYAHYILIYPSTYWNRNRAGFLSLKWAIDLFFFTVLFSIPRGRINQNKLWRILIKLYMHINCDGFFSLVTSRILCTWVWGTNNLTYIYMQPANKVLGWKN